VWRGEMFAWRVAQAGKRDVRRSRWLHGHTRIARSRLSENAAPKGLAPRRIPFGMCKLVDDECGAQAFADSVLRLAW